MTLKSDAAAARKAADAAASKNTPKEDLRELNAAAVELENELAFQDWKTMWEGKGYTVEGDSFVNAKVLEEPDGPSYVANPGA